MEIVWSIDAFSSFFPPRFDYEGLDPRAAFYLMRDLEAVITDKAFTSQKFAVGDHVYGVEKAENFEYIDPVDGSVTRNQVSGGSDRKWRTAVHAESVGMEMFRDDPVPIPVSGIGIDTGFFFKISKFNQLTFNTRIENPHEYLSGLATSYFRCSSMGQ